VGDSTVKGVKLSLLIVQRSPNCDSVETRVWKAV